MKCIKELKKLQDAKQAKFFRCQSTTSVVGNKKPLLILRCCQCSTCCAVTDILGLLTLVTGLSYSCYTLENKSFYSVFLVSYCLSYLHVSQLIDHPTCKKTNVDNRYLLLTAISFKVEVSNF